MKKQINVVGAVIVRQGEVLCAQRGAAGALPGMWEFPGGKVELGESPQAALEREIEEELRCRVRVGELVVSTTHEYDFGEVILTTFLCGLLEGAPTVTEHASIRWVAPDHLEQLEWAPADIEAVRRVRSMFSTSTASTG